MSLHLNHPAVPRPVGPVGPVGSVGPVALLARRQRDVRQRAQQRVEEVGPRAPGRHAGFTVVSCGKGQLFVQTKWEGSEKKPEELEFEMTLKATHMRYKYL